MKNTLKAYVGVKYYKDYKNKAIVDEISSIFDFPSLHLTTCRQGFFF